VDRGYNSLEVFTILMLPQGQVSCNRRALGYSMPTWGSCCRCMHTALGGGQVVVTACQRTTHIAAKGDWWVLFYRLLAVAGTLRT